MLYNDVMVKQIFFGVNSLMAEAFDQNNKHQEVGEEQLTALIKQAGDEARARKRSPYDYDTKKDTTK
jgi:hypothetical protein